MQEKKKPTQIGGKKATSDVQSQSTSPQVPDVSGALEKIEKAKVTVMHGAQDAQFPVVGETVKSVRAAVLDAFNVPADAMTFVNGEAVDESYVLKENDTLEFVKQAGVKGKFFFVNFD